MESASEQPVLIVSQDIIIFLIAGVSALLLLAFCAGRCCRAAAPAATQTQSRSLPLLILGGFLSIAFLLDYCDCIVSEAKLGSTRGAFVRCLLTWPKAISEFVTELLRALAWPAFVIFVGYAMYIWRSLPTAPAAPTIASVPVNVAAFPMRDLSNPPRPEGSILHKVRSPTPAEGVAALEQVLRDRERDRVGNIVWFGSLM